MRLAMLLFAAAVAQADGASLAGLQLGRHTLTDVLSRFGNSPLRNGEVDEVCYRSESPLEPYWVIFGSGAEGNYERLTQFRLLSSPPPGITCPPSARLTPDLARQLGLRIGRPGEEVTVKLAR
jgi:hypothetical protein